MSFLHELRRDGRGKVLAFCWLGWLFDFYDLVLFAFLQKDVAGELHLDDQDLAWILALTFAATAFGGFWFGRIADRQGRRRALTLAILVYSLGALLTGFADGFATLVLARVITGLGVGGEWGIGHAIVAETFPRELRGRAAGILQAATPLAMALAAVVGLLAGPEIGWRWCFWLSALPALLACFARRMLPTRAAPAAADRASLLELFRQPYLRRSVFLLVLLTVHMAGFWCTYFWMPKALLGQYHATPMQVLGYQLAVNGMQFLADLAFGFLADRFGRRRVFTALCLLFAGGLVFVASRFGQIAAEMQTFTLAMAITGFGTGTWSCFGPLFAANYPESLRATAASGFYNLGRGAQFFVQPWLPWLIATTGTHGSVLMVSAAMGVLSAVLIWRVPDES